MKKVTLKDLNGKIIETYFATDHPNNFPTNMENHTVEGVPSDKNWTEMTGGQYDDPDHPLNKHDEGQMYNMNEQDVNENSAGGEAHVAWSALTKSLLNKIELQESESQIKIDDTIPSDFVDTVDLHLGSIYVVAGLGLTAKFVTMLMIPEGGGCCAGQGTNKTLLQMKRHGIIFYVEEGRLMKATSAQVDDYLNEPF